MKNEGLRPEQKEALELNPKEFWLIDDDTDIVSSLLMSWRSKLQENDLSCQAFETGESVLQEVQRRIKEGVAMPSFLLIDGELNKDEQDSEFRLGSNLVRFIRSTDNISQPTIIAHSSSDKFNNDMIEAGANTSLAKGDRKIIDYFQGLSEGKK